MKKHIITTTALALALSLSACGGTEATVSEPQDTAKVAEQQPEAPKATPKAEPKPVQTPEQEQEPAQPELAAYGETYTYDDGLEVKIEYAGTATSDGAGSQATNGQVVLFDVTITNGTGSMIDPSMHMAEVSYGDTQKVAEEVFDSSQGWEGMMFTLPTNLLPGKKTTVTGAFAMPHGKSHEVLFSFAPDFDHEPAMYYGTINTK